MALEQINKYYNEADIDYRWLWGVGTNFSIHYGFYDKEHTSHDQALLNFNRVLADTARITRDDIVLDAGCGVGGSSVWLAKNIGCKVFGININEIQLEKANIWARRNKVSDLTEFSSQNYLRTTFPDSFFTVVWGEESICHAENKKSFLAEAKRLLKDGGRIIIADGFLNRTPEREHEKKYFSLWLKGWAVPNLSHKDEFRRYLEELGYKSISFRNVTEHVLPSSRRLYIAAILLYLLGLRTKLQMDNIRSAFYQYSILKSGLWVHGIFYAEK